MASVNSNTVLLPHPPSTDGPRSKTQPSRYPPLSPAAYIRGVITIDAFRTYYFSDMAVHSLTHLIWLQGQAAALTTSALPDLDERAHPHLACYRSEFHDAASLTENRGLIGAVPVTAPAHSASRPAVTMGSCPSGSSRVSASVAAATWVETRAGESTFAPSAGFCIQQGSARRRRPDRHAHSV